MSNLAYARPTMAQARPSVAPTPELSPRHIEIVATRAQRRARPKMAYAVVTIGCLFAIFAAQLLLSIVVSDGAYQISTLQTQQRELQRTQQALTERLQLQDSTQYLATSAAALGMVPGTSALFLNLQSGAVSAAPGTKDPTGCGGNCGLVANSLLAAVPLAGTAPAVEAAATPATGAPVTTGQAPAAAPGTVPAADLATVTVLPAPVTH